MRISDWSSDVCSSDLLAELLVVEVRKLLLLGQFLQILLDRGRALDEFGDQRRHRLDHRDHYFGIGLQRHPFVSVELARRRREEAVEVGELRAGEFARIGFREPVAHRSEEHTSELQSLMRKSYDVY